MIRKACNAMHAAVMGDIIVQQVKLERAQGGCLGTKSR